MSGACGTPLTGNCGQAAVGLNIPAGKYYWSVRTIDSGFRMSAWSPEQASYPNGDLNCDGSVNFRDINPFVQYLSDFSVWQAAYAGCPSDIGDINGDGTYPSLRDINPFVALLTGG